ncbi:MAG TPA: hypothetical protein VFV15_00260 [Moraxellaceae bacterium]|nr:hypothetical protein [Moraxellaceae bacterium]
MTDSPSPLLELPPAPPSPEGLARRWFSSAEMDLIVWSRNGAVVAFQLCHGKPLAEQSLTWRQGQGFSSQAVDAGEAMELGHKATPLLTAAMPVDPAPLRLALGRAGGALPADLLAFVDRHLAGEAA